MLKTLSRLVLTVFAMLAFVAATILALATAVPAATYVCTRTTENPMQDALLVTGSCVPSGAYTGNPGDTVGTAATVPQTAAVFCGSAQRILRNLVTGTGAANAGAAAVAFKFDIANNKMQAYTAAASPGLAVALAEGDSSLTLTNLAFHFVAVCQ